MRRENEPTHYEVLGVMADASSDEIRRCYRVRAKAAHPDAGGDVETFRRVQEAYQTLIDADLRQEYDDAHGIRRFSPVVDGGFDRGGWLGAHGDFTGDVSFPSYLRDVTEKPWQATPSVDPDAARHAGVDAGIDPSGVALPADVVWWWPDQAIAPPVRAEGLLVVVAADRAVAIDPLTGYEAWRAPLGSRPAGPPVVVGDTVAVWTADGVLHGLEVGRGVTRWQVQIGPPSPGGLVPVPLPGRHGATAWLVAAARADAKLVGFDPVAGQAVWVAKLASVSTQAIATGGGAVFAVAGTTIEGVDARKGRHRWRIALKAPVELPPCAVRQNLWVAGGASSGTLVRLDPATGAVAGTFRGGSAVAGLDTDGDVLFASVAGPPRIIAVDEGGHLHLSVELPNVCPEPAIGPAHVFVADPTGRVFAIDRLRRTVAAAVTVPFEPLGAPVAFGDLLVLLARDGRLWAISQPRR